MSGTKKRPKQGESSRASLSEQLSQRFPEAMEGITSSVDAVASSVEEVVDTVKPLLRGWLHMVMTPLALVGGMIAITVAPTLPGRIAALIFTITAGLLFAISAIYHRGHWSPSVGAALRRMDHANIFLIIAGSYTPFALLLPRPQATTLLTIVWSGAVAGVLFRVFWVSAPRWFYVPIYVALGWVAIFYIGPLITHGGWLIVSLILLGGVFYTAGAIVYGLKKPNPSPTWFGFHEIFHACTIAAFSAHFAAVLLALLGPIAQQAN